MSSPARVDMNPSHQKSVHFEALPPINHAQSNSSSPMTSGTISPSYYQSHASSFSSSSSSSSSRISHLSTARVFYKLVARCGPNQFFSIYDGKTEYILGSTMYQPIKSDDINDGNGFFVYSTPEEATNASLPDNSALFIAPRVLLKCMCWGDYITYNHNIYSFSYLRPLQIFPLDFGYLCTQFPQRKITTIQLNTTRKRLPIFKAPNARILKTFTERAHLTRLSGEIQAMEKEIVDLTRKQLYGSSGARPSSVSSASASTSASAAATATVNYGATATGAYSPLSGVSSN